MSVVDTTAKSDLSNDEVIRQKIQTISSLSRDDIVALEFDIIYGICQATKAWETPSGEVAGSVMKHKDDFKERLYAVGLMKSTRKSEITYRQFAKLCHLACECLLNEYDAENQTFNQSETYQTVTSGAWGGIWKVAEAVAKEGGEVNSVKRLEVAKEGFELCKYLLNEGDSSSKEAVKERCSSLN